MGNTHTGVNHPYLDALASNPFLAKEIDLRHDMGSKLIPAVLAPGEKSSTWGSSPVGRVVWQ